jgi:hypothetical protein
MLRMIAVLTLLLSVMGAAEAQMLRSIQMPGGGRYMYPTEEYFSLLEKEQCLAFDEKSHGRGICEQELVFFRGKWEKLHSDIYQMELKSQVPSAEFKSDLMKRSNDLAAEGKQFTEIVRKEISKYIVYSK